MAGNIISNNIPWAVDHVFGAGTYEQGPLVLKLAVNDLVTADGALAETDVQSLVNNEINTVVAAALDKGLGFMFAGAASAEVKALADKEIPVIFADLTAAGTTITPAEEVIEKGSITSEQDQNLLSEADKEAAALAAVGNGSGGAQAV